MPLSDANKLRWRCRRGTLELDAILLRYLNRRYAAADPAEKKAFAELLALEDDRLIQLLLNDTPAGNAGQQRLITAIKQTLA